jgi:uncharacterized protein YciI
MKYILMLTMLVIFSASSEVKSNNPKFDPELATKLGADDYGMKSYVLVMLKSGSNNSKVESTKTAAFRGHMENIKRLVALDKLLIAGPMGKNDKSYRGIFILNVTTLAEAETLLSSDPAIKAQYLDAELYKWYGSAALSEYLPASDKIWKVSP